MTKEGCGCLLAAGLEVIIMAQKHITKMGRVTTGSVISRLAADGCTSVPDMVVVVTRECPWLTVSAKTIAGYCTRYMKEMGYPITNSNPF